MEIFVAHRYHKGTHPGLPGLPQTDGEFYKNSEQLKAVNYCHKQLHLRCCSRLWKNDQLCDQLQREMKLKVSR